MSINIKEIPPVPVDPTFAIEGLTKQQMQALLALTGMCARDGILSTVYYRLQGRFTRAHIDKHELTNAIEFIFPKEPKPK